MLLALLVGLLAQSYGYSLNQDNSLLSEQLEQPNHRAVIPVQTRRGPVASLAM